MPALALLASELTFDVLAGVVDMAGRCTTEANYGAVQKVGLLGKANRCGLVKGRGAYVGKNGLANELDRTGDRGAKIPDVGTQGQKDSVHAPLDLTNKRDLCLDMIEDLLDRNRELAYSDRDLTNNLHAIKNA